MLCDTCRRATTGKGCDSSSPGSEGSDPRTCCQGSGRHLKSAQKLAWNRPRHRCLNNSGKAPADGNTLVDTVRVAAHDVVELVGPGPTLSRPISRLSRAWPLAFLRTWKRRQQNPVGRDGTSQCCPTWHHGRFTRATRPHTNRETWCLRLQHATSVPDAETARLDATHSCWTDDACSLRYPQPQNQ